MQALVMEPVPERAAAAVPLAVPALAREQVRAPERALAALVPELGQVPAAVMASEEVVARGLAMVTAQRLPAA